MNLAKSWGYILGVAQQRLEHNRTPRHVATYGSEIEVLGAAGELAARRFLGLSENLHTQFDHGVDLSWRSYRVDVKTTKLTEGLAYRFLQWPTWKLVKSDLVIMTAVCIPTKTATVVGWIWKQDVECAQVNPERDIPCHEIPVPALRPMWELFVINDACARTAPRAWRQPGREEHH